MNPPRMEEARRTAAISWSIIFPYFGHGGVGPLASSIGANHLGTGRSARLSLFGGMRVRFDLHGLLPKQQDQRGPHVRLRTRRPDCGKPLKDSSSLRWGLEINRMGEIALSDHVARTAAARVDPLLRLICVGEGPSCLSPTTGIVVRERACCEDIIEPAMDGRWTSLPCSVLA